MIESVTVDRGKVFVSDTFTAACERLQVSITKAAPLSPHRQTPHRRVFASISSRFTECLAGYARLERGPPRRRPGRRSGLAVGSGPGLLDQWIADAWAKPTLSAFGCPDRQGQNSGAPSSRT